LPFFQFFLGAVFLQGIGSVLLGLAIREQIVTCDVLIDGIHFRIADITEAHTRIELTRLRVIEPCIIESDVLIVGGHLTKTDHDVCMSVEVDISLPDIAECL